MFDRQKASVLSRTDHSKKGSVDEPVRKLVAMLNSKDDFYTTSSCSGRIVLMVEAASGLKKDTEWLYVSHDAADEEKIRECLNKLPEERVWLRMEPFILHISVRTLEIADNLMKRLMVIGLKHSGILGTSKRIMLEISGNEHMDIPVSENGKMLTTDEYLSYIVRAANEKLERNHLRLQKLESLFQSE